MDGRDTFQLRNLWLVEGIALEEIPANMKLINRARLV
jgi:hypothetical protein